MTRRREIEQRLHRLSEISGIMDSMNTLALMETRKLSRFLAAQHRVVEGIEAAAADFGSFYPVARGQTEGATEAVILVGSERGFCGDFNEILVDALDRSIMHMDADQNLFTQTTRDRSAAIEAYLSKSTPQFTGE